MKQFACHPCGLIFRCLSLLIFTAVLLSACGNNGGQTLSVSDENAFSPTEDFSSVGTLEYLPLQLGSDGFSDDRGFYRILPNKDASNTLSFIDYASQQETVVCNRPECTHSDETCTAWLPYSGGAMLVIPVGKKLVYLYGGNPNFFDELGANASARLETSDLNGVNRKAHHVFNATTTIGVGLGTMRHGFAKDDRYLYFLAQNYRGKNEDFKLVQLLCAFDSIEGCVYQLAELDTTARIVGAYDGKLVLDSCPNAVSIQNEAGGLTAQLTLFSLADFSQTPVASYPFTSQGACREDQFYSLNADGRLETVFLVNGEKKILGDVFPGRDMQMFRVIGFVENLLFVQEDHTIQDGETVVSNRFLHAINVSDASVQDVPFFYSGYEKNRYPYQVIAQIEENYLVVMDETERSVEVPQMGTVNAPTRVYGMIRCEDFWNGQDTFQIIHAVN